MDKIEGRFRGCDSRFGFLLEAVKNINGSRQYGYNPQT